LRITDSFGSLYWNRFERPRSNVSARLAMVAAKVLAGFASSTTSTMWITRIATMSRPMTRKRAASMSMPRRAVVPTAMTSSSKPCNGLFRPHPGMITPPTQTRLASADRVTSGGGGVAARAGDGASVDDVRDIWGALLLRRRGGV
jgi:hypothetical protein